MTLIASLVATGAERNNVFEVANQANRDDCLRCFRVLHDYLSQSDIELNTADLNVGKTVHAELHVDAGQPVLSTNAYLILFETPLIHRPNGDVGGFQSYRKVFTWNDDLLAMDPDKFVKINYPVNLNEGYVDGFRTRPGFCCLIAGNKTVSAPDKRELYSERIKTIRWFEKNAPDDFDLHGIGWNAPARRRGWLGKIQNKLGTTLLQRNSRFFFPSYRGAAHAKAQVYAKYRFAICYENVRDLRGYITEKIFDAMCSGCVPVYWGASNVSDYIPVECFIDRRQFRDHEELYRNLKMMREGEFRNYQEATRSFLFSDAAWIFSAEAFAKTVVQTIVADMRKQTFAL